MRALFSKFKSYIQSRFTQLLNKKWLHTNVQTIIFLSKIVFIPSWVDILLLHDKFEKKKCSFVDFTRSSQNELYVSHKQVTGGRSTRKSRIEIKICFTQIGKKRRIGLPSAVLVGDAATTTDTAIA